jgi:hypothetical protein
MVGYGCVGAWHVGSTDEIDEGATQASVFVTADGLYSAIFQGAMAGGLRSRPGDALGDALRACHVWTCALVWQCGA